MTKWTSPAGDHSLTSLCRGCNLCVCHTQRQLSLQSCRGAYTHFQRRVEAAVLFVIKPERSQVCWLCRHIAVASLLAQRCSSRVTYCLSPKVICILSQHFSKKISSRCNLTSTKYPQQCNSDRTATNTASWCRCRCCSADPSWILLGSSQELLPWLLGQRSTAYVIIAMAHQPMQASLPLGLCCRAYYC